MSVSHLNEEDCVYWKNRDQLKADCWHMYMSLCADAYRQCGEGEEGSVCVCVVVVVWGFPMSCRFWATLSC